jgi:hypothetical protein
VETLRSTVLLCHPSISDIITALHAGNMPRDSHVLLCDATERTLHSNSPFANEENTVPILLAACVLQVLSSSGSTCHNNNNNNFNNLAILSFAMQCATRYGERGYYH